MAEDLLDTLVALEQQGWSALCDGTASDFYGRVMTADGLMVLAHGGALTRREVVASLRDAPTWDSFGLSEMQLVRAGRDGAALVYLATARRGDEQPFTARMASVYVEVDTSWRLALYTQTPMPA